MTGGNNTEIHVKRDFSHCKFFHFWRYFFLYIPELGWNGIILAKCKSGCKVTFAWEHSLISHLWEDGWKVGGFSQKRKTVRHRKIRNKERWCLNSKGMSKISKIRCDLQWSTGEGAGEGWVNCQFWAEEKHWSVVENFVIAANPA